jgi:hypothetical protein
MMILPTHLCRALQALIPFILLVGSAQGQLRDSVIYEEHFDTNVIGPGGWSATDASIYVDTLNGWLHIDSDGDWDDYAEKDLAFSLPVVIEIRTRLVDNHGHDYTLPLFGFYSSTFDSSWVVFLPGDEYGWAFLQGWTGVQTMGPISVNQWRTIKAIVRTDGGELWVKADSDTAFTLVIDTTWMKPSDQIRLLFKQPFDAVCDLDYVKVTSLLSYSLDSLIISTVSVKPCDDGCAAQPVMTKLSQPINGASIPIEIPPEVDSICGISFEGLLTEDWDIKGDSIDYANGWIHVYLANTFGERIPTDTTTVFNILFKAARECTTGYYIHWDTCLSQNEQRKLLFSDTFDLDLPAYFDPNRDSTEILGYIPGNVNDDGSVNVVDLTYLVNWLFRGGLAPCVLNSADCNGSCTGPNVADVTYLVSYLFRGGQAPKCGCLGGSKGAPKLSPDISVAAVYESGITTVTLNSPVPLRGLQIELTGSGATTPISLLDGQLDLLYGESGSGLRVGLLDLEGEAVIQAGTQKVIELPGEFEVTEAIMSDMNHYDIAASIGASNGTTLPTEFALSQNYPNPFNPSTEISFSLPNASDVKLEVYNVMGQKVAVVVDEYLQAGEHTALWDAGSFSSGVYFYRLEAGEFVETRKMVLLK